MFDKNVFGNRIRSLRKARGVSQTDLGKALSFYKSRISDIENGKNSTTIENLYALAKYFDVSSDYLIGLTDNPDPK